MELINARDICYNNGSRSILEEASFRILPAKKYGLIGPNGAGKTTLIRILIQQLEIEKGSLHLKENLNWSLVPQNPDTGGEKTILEYMLDPLKPLQVKLTSLEEKMASVAEDELPKLLHTYQKTQELFECKGGYSAGEQIENLLKSLGMDNSSGQLVNTLSGGELSLLFFARALLGNPELLILDEPGNHLDYLGLAWLEIFLKNFKGAVLIVSHNRYMIDKVCEEIWDIYSGRLSTFTGNYSSYRINKLRTAVIQQSDYVTSQQNIAKLERREKQLQSITTTQYNPPARVMAELGAVQGKLIREKKNMVEKPLINTEKITWRLNNTTNRSQLALEIKNLSLAFPEKILFSDGSLTLNSGDKAALVGANGSGKTTLLKKILDDGCWDSSEIRIGPSQKVGYLSQTPSFSPKAKTIEDEVRSWGTMSRDDIFALISRFLFSYEDMEKELRVLSGGERNRLQLARLMYQQANFLILDEPTNHMDIPTREVMEEVLKEFPGTLLVVSHDRYFIDKIAERVIEIDNQKLTSHTGNFSDFFALRFKTLPRLSGKVSSRGSDKKNAAKQNSSIEASRIEKRIEELEFKKEKMAKDLENTFSTNDHIKGRQLAAKLEKFERQLSNLYSEWENVL